MLNPSRDWIEQIKYVCHEMINQKTSVLTGTITSIDSTPPYKVKVMLEPFGIETGWLRLAMPLTGNGYGVLLPPPDEGTEVKCLFDMGDIKSGVVIGSVYDEQTVKMPSAEFGAMGLVHKSGANIILNNDGSITLNTTNGINIGGTGGKALARVGDSVQVDTTTGTGTITSGSSNAKST